MWGSGSSQSYHIYIIQLSPADCGCIDIPGFAKVASLDEIRANDGNLSIQLYVRGRAGLEVMIEYGKDKLKIAIQSWKQNSENLQATIDSLLRILE